MKNILPLLISLVFLPFSHIAFADFNLPGSGKVTYPTGIEKSFDFGFAWQANTQKFTIGKKSYSMDHLPESYSVAITLSKDDEQVWVQEFNNGFIEAFEWQIGKHAITLKKKKFSDPVKGDYVISLNERSYFFARSNASIIINFDESGIETIAINGVTKNMGTKD
jgi:hypothetical protein